MTQWKSKVSDHYKFKLKDTELTHEWYCRLKDLLKPKLRYFKNSKLKETELTTDWYLGLKDQSKLKLKEK